MVRYPKKNKRLLESLIDLALLLSPTILAAPAMANPSSSENAASERIVQLPDDSTIWENLKQAIAASSGFNRWQIERTGDAKISGLNLDHRVRYYLRETLETLAY